MKTYNEKTTIATTDSKTSYNGSIQTTARLAGLVYFVFMIISIVSEFLLPNYFVKGDPTATSINIGSNELAYRFSILFGLVTLVIFIFLVVILYKLLKDVDRSKAMLMVLLVTIGVAISFSNLLNKFAPLVILSEETYLSIFNTTQLDTITYFFLRFRGSSSVIPMVFWGLWLFPFGILVIKSGFIPRILGILLLVAVFAFIITSITTIILPDYRQLVSKIMMPLYVGEVPIIFWLLIKGVKLKELSNTTSEN